MENPVIKKSLEILDLSDSANGLHAINLMVDLIYQTLQRTPGNPWPIIKRASPITTVEENFDLLYFPADNLSRSPIYTRYIDDKKMLRTHTTAQIPEILKEIKKNDVHNYLVMCPGICFRRDVIDRKHVGEPHQMDIWHIKKGEPRITRDSLLSMVKQIVNLVYYGAQFRANEVEHPYTDRGLEVEIMVNGEWLEILECGEIKTNLLTDSGLDPKEYSGLAMGLGLDRLVMIIKKIDDIRLLRSENPKIKEQMRNLKIYQPVSKFPAIKQDISISVSVNQTEEDICEIARETLQDKIESLEELKIISITAYEQLPPQAIERLNIKPGQKNVLLRLIFRSHEKTLLQEEANEMRDMIYRALDETEGGGYIKK
jgi:phenylalanyl-tRNA synthetase alpha chain